MGHCGDWKVLGRRGREDDSVDPWTLAGGLEHDVFHILGMSSSQRTFIFVQRS